MINAELLTVLRGITDDIASKDLEFAKETVANELVCQNVFAFCLAGCLDRQAQSDRVWLVPQFLKTKWGHLEPEKIAAMSTTEVANALRESHCGWRLKIEDVARTAIALSKLVHEQCGDDAKRIFDGSVSAIRRRLESIPGVGPGIANVLLIQRIRYFGLRPEELDSLDVKADSHIVRVFYRMGISEAETERSALAAAANLDPMDRIAADQAAWHIGRDYCFKKDPNCFECPVEPHCPRVESEPPDFRSKKYDWF